MSYVSELAGKKCLVIGAGVTGQAVDKALKKFGAISYLFDEKNGFFRSNNHIYGAKFPHCSLG